MVTRARGRTIADARIRQRPAHEHATRQHVPGPHPTRQHPGGKPSRLLACAAALGLLLTACSTPAATTPAPTTTAPPTSVPTPVEQCANLLTYWLDRHLTGAKDTLDYQSMGLTGDQYNAYRTLTTQADRLTPLPREWTRTESAKACERIAATATPWSGGPGWPR